MNSSLTTHYEGLVRQVLVETGLATRAVALAKLADGKVDWSKWVTLILLALILATQFYFAHNINARLDRMEASLTIRMDRVEAGLNALIVRMDRVEAGLNALIVRMDGVEAGLSALIIRMDGLEEEVHQRSVWQQEHNDLYRRTER